MLCVYTTVEASEGDDSADLAAELFTELRDYMIYNRDFFGARHVEIVDYGVEKRPAINKVRGVDQKCVRSSVGHPHPHCQHRAVGLRGMATQVSRAHRLPPWPRRLIA